MTQSTPHRQPESRRRMGALASLLAVGLALGSAGTISLFTDTAPVSGSTFTAGVLDLSASDQTSPLKADDMAPGDVVSDEVTLTNGGTLPLEYSVTVTQENPADRLAEVLDISVRENDDSGAEVLTVAGITGNGSATTDEARVLEPGESDTLHLQAELRQDAETEYAGAKSTLIFTFDAEVSGEPAAEPAPAPARMVSTWNTTLPECADTTIELPLEGVISGVVDWGDGTTSELTETPSHTYAQPGVHTITVDGQFEKFAAADLYADEVSMDAAGCLVSVDEWGETGTVEVNFAGTYHLADVAEIPSTVTNLMGLFYSSTFHGDISTWDTSAVTNMMAAFSSSYFHGDISGWDTSSVQNMSHTFQDAAFFNSPIGDWDTSSVTTLDYTFDGAQIFNQDLSSWDTSKVTSMRETFRNALRFNQDLPWDTSSVVVMEGTFSDARDFNGDISSWDTSKVTSMRHMFSLARAFNRDISDWDISSVKEMRSMFEYAESFNQDLSSWTFTGDDYAMRDFARGATAWQDEYKPKHAPGQPAPLPPGTDPK